MSGAPGADDDRLLEHLWVLRAQVGDPSAYMRLFERYNARLQYYVRRIVGRSAAEDVVQDVWLTVLRKLGSLEEPLAFRTWLYRIAHNRAVSRLRKMSREVPLEDAAEEELNQMMGTSASEDSEGAESFAQVDAVRLNAALDRLSGPHRRALTLRFLEGLSYEEIAKVEGVGVGTVRSRLHYGKKSLKAEIQCGPD